MSHLHSDLVLMDPQERTERRFITKNFDGILDLWQWSRVHVGDGFVLIDHRCDDREYATDWHRYSFYSLVDARDMFTGSSLQSRDWVTNAIQTIMESSRWDIPILSLHPPHKMHIHLFAGRCYIAQLN